MRDETLYDYRSWGIYESLKTPRLSSFRYLHNNFNIRAKSELSRKSNKRLNEITHENATKMSALKLQTIPLWSRTHVARAVSENDKA